MKGLEGLPLKYILIVLVAALIIAAIVSVVTTWTKSLKTQAEKASGTMEESTSRQLCEMKVSTGICYPDSIKYNKTLKSWVCNSTASNQYEVC